MGRSYFVSDVHLGLASDRDNRREKDFVSFLQSLPEDTDALYLLGDIFDFWVDFHDVVPRGHVSVLAELKNLASRAKVYFFKGNHDYWVTDYFEKELGVKIVDEPYIIEEIDGQKVCMGHGDVLKCSDWKANLIFHLFRNKACIFFMRGLPPRWSFSLARNWSQGSRRRNAAKEDVIDVESSDIYRFAREFSQEQKIDYFVFGHLHRRACISVGNATMYVLGDWSEGEDYLYLSGMKMSGRSLPNIMK